MAAAEAPSGNAPGRVPPNQLEAEAAVLSAMILKSSVIDDLIDFGFSPIHCYADANRDICQAIFDLHVDGSQIDIVTLSNLLRTQGRLSKVGGMPYLAQIIEATPAIAHVEGHARLVIEAWRTRQAIKVCQLGAAEGYAAPADTQGFLENLEMSVAEIAHGGRVVTLEQVGKISGREVARIAEARSRGESMVGLPTGFRDLDQLIGGLSAGDLYIIAARPGVGKTAFATSLSMNIARRLSGETRDQAVLFCSLEMPREQIAMRFACHEASVGIARLRTSTLNRAEWDKLLEADAQLRAAPVWIDDAPTLTLLELRAKVRKLRREIRSGAAEVPCVGLGAVVIDYLQLMQGITRKGGSREEEIASLSRGLKALAKEERLPVVALAQLNRNVEKNTKDKRPQLHDLRESGSIEQDADTVAFLYRENYYDKSANKNSAECNIAKQRNGPTGTVSLFLDRDPMRFYDVERQSDWSPEDEDAYYR